jgi:hypothetical protein
VTNACGCSASSCNQAKADARLLARFDADASQWHITDGNYRIALVKTADDLVVTKDAQLTGRLFTR